MEIYEQEVLDNLADAIKSQASVAMICPILENHDFSGDLSDSISSALASIGVDKIVQSDLYYLNSILVSAGWNKNDDVFAVEDLWGARHTPADKPFNYMHDETDIIGHMTATAVMGPDGSLIDDSTPVENLPDRVDIVTSAVIYKSWTDPEQKQRVLSYIDAIKKGEYAVSMEVMFRNFDYALVSPDGEHKVLARTKDSAFLTKYLTAYGGEGEYKGYKVGRLLRDIYFTGKGLVDQPANPRSIIFKESDPFSGSQANTEIFKTVAMENNMELEQLKTDLESAKAQAQTLQAKADELNSALAEKNQVISALEVKVNELNDAIASITSEKDGLSVQLNTMLAEAKLLKRQASLKDYNIEDAKAQELLTKFAEASDETFEYVVSLLPKAEAATKQCSKCEKASEDCDDDKEKDMEDDKSEALDNVETEKASLKDTEEAEDEIQKAFASAAKYFEQHVLKTTKSNK